SSWNMSSMRALKALNLASSASSVVIGPVRKRKQGSRSAGSNCTREKGEKAAMVIARAMAGEMGKSGRGCTVGSNGRHMGVEEEGRNIGGQGRGGRRRRPRATVGTSVAEESTTRSDGRQRRGGKVLRLRATMVVIAAAIGKGNDAAGQRRKKVANRDAATCVEENVAGRRLWQGVGGCAQVEQRPRRVWLGGCGCNCG
ncbi:hypothetical protein BHE74_00050923, partial [Ensete ventricosum]